MLKIYILRGEQISLRSSIWNHISFRLATKIFELGQRETVFKEFLTRYVFCDCGFLEKMGDLYLFFVRILKWILKTETLCFYIYLVLASDVMCRTILIFKAVGEMLFAGLSIITTQNCVTDRKYLFNLAVVGKGNKFNWKYFFCFIYCLVDLHNFINKFTWSQSKKCHIILNLLFYHIRGWIIKYIFVVYIVKTTPVNYIRIWIPKYWAGR